MSLDHAPTPTRAKKLFLVLGFVLLLLVILQLAPLFIGSGKEARDSIGDRLVRKREEARSRDGAPARLIPSGARTDGEVTVSAPGGPGDAPDDISDNPVVRAGSIDRARGFPIHVIFRSKIISAEGGEVDPATLEKAIRELSDEEGWGVVIDAEAVTTSYIPFVIHFRPERDVSEAVREKYDALLRGMENPE
jgi:hypothetical protein